MWWPAPGTQACCGAIDAACGALSQLPQFIAERDCARGLEKNITAGVHVLVRVNLDDGKIRESQVVFPDFVRCDNID